MIAAALAGHHLKVTACESRGGTRAAEMDEGGKILLLLRAGLDVACARQNPSHVAIQIHGRQFGGMARDRAKIETGESTSRISTTACSRIQNRAASAAVASSIWNKPTAEEAGW